MTTREFKAEASFSRNKLGEDIYEKERARGLQISDKRWNKINAIIAAVVGLIAVIFAIAIFLQK